MVHRRLFLVGLILLFLGVQFRVVKTFVLTERASTFIQTRLKRPSPDTLTLPTASLDPIDAPWGPSAIGMREEFSPPLWLGWSLISVGAVLVLTSPCFKP